MELQSKRNRRINKRKNRIESKNNSFFKSIINGLGFGFGFFIVLVGLFIIAYAGWHPASQIISGVFKGNYTFNGSVNFSKGLTAKNISTPVIKIIPVKNFSQIVNYNVSKGAALFYDNVSIVNDCDPFHDGSGVALYKLDGNAVDACGKHNGTDISSDISYVSGKFGLSSSFNGSSNEHIDFEPINISSKVFSISAWVKRDHTGTAASVGIVQQNNSDYTNILAVVPSTGEIYIGNKVSYLGINTSWNHLVVVYYIGGCDLYVNGVRVLYNQPVATNYNSLYSIGNRRKYSSTYVWKGLIDQVRVFNRALTPEEVKELYHEEKEALFMKTPDGNIERIATVSNS